VRVSDKNTDVDRAVAAIGGVQLTYHTFGPFKMRPRTPAQVQIFTYNELGEPEYVPAPQQLVPAAAPPVDSPHELPAAALETWAAPSRAAPAAPPAAAAMPALLAAALPSAAAPNVAQYDPMTGPEGEPVLGMPGLWRGAGPVAPSAPKVAAAPAASGEAGDIRSLSDMFSMLAGRASPPSQAGRAGGGAAAAPQSTPTDERDLFRRL
jgi:hypothetical protein